MSRGRLRRGTLPVLGERDRSLSYLALLLLRVSNDTMHTLETRTTVLMKSRTSLALLVIPIESRGLPAMLAGPYLAEVMVR